MESRCQTKRIHVGDGVAVGVGVAVEGNGLGDLAGDDIRVDKSPQLRAIVPGSHVDEAVGIRIRVGQAPQVARGIENKGDGKPPPRSFYPLFIS